MFDSLGLQSQVTNVWHNKSRGATACPVMDCSPVTHLLPSLRDSGVCVNAYLGLKPQAVISRRSATGETALRIEKLNWYSIGK